MLQKKKGFPNNTLLVAILVLALLFTFAGSEAPRAEEGREQTQKTSRSNSEPLSEAISPDRPGFSTGPIPLARGHFQIEGGYQFARENDDGNVKEHTAPLLLIRFGVLTNLEMQISWPGYTWKKADGVSSRDRTDTVLAAKTLLTPQRGAIPSLGLLAALSLPTGSREASSDGFDPILGLLWSYGWKNLGLFGNLLFSRVSSPGDDFLQTAASAGASVPWTERLGSYAEYFVFFREDRRPSHNLNGGFTYLLTRDFQVDLHGGIGLNRAANDYFLGAGFAKRW